MLRFPGFARSTRALALAAVLATAAAALLGGCSGSGGGDATRLLRQTFTASHSIRSGRLTLALGLDLHGLQSLNGPININLNGPFQSGGAGQLPKFNLGLTLQASGASFSAGIVSTADKAFLLFEGTPYVVPDAQFASFKQSYLQAQANSRKSGSTTLGSLGIDPARWLVNPHTAGSQIEGGTQTTHITAGIDVARLLDDINTVLSKAGRLGTASLPTSVPQSLSPQQRSALAHSVKSANVNVYTGQSDKLLRRLDFNLNLSVPSNLRTQARGLTSGTINFTLGLDQVNQPQAVSTPANAKPLSTLLSALAGAGAANGSAGGGGAGAGTGAVPRGGSGAGGAPQGSAPQGSSPQGGSGAGGSGAGGGTSSQQNAYLSCVQRAGKNLRAVQKCASLLNR